MQLLHAWAKYLCVIKLRKFVFCFLSIYGIKYYDLGLSYGAIRKHLLCYVLYIFIKRFHVLCHIKKDQSPSM